MHHNNQNTLNAHDEKTADQSGIAGSATGTGADQLLNPFWLIIITVVAGLAASAPLAGAMVARCGYRNLGWIGGALLTIVGALVLVIAVGSGVEWYWISLLLTAFHIVCGSGLYLLLRKPHRVLREKTPSSPAEKGGYRQIITGMIGGAMVALLFGMVGVPLYVLLTDRLLSTLMPVTFADEFALYKLFVDIIFLVLSGTIAGGFIGRAKPGITPGQIIFYGFGLLWAYLTWSFALEVFIAVPGFQAGAATGSGWTSLIVPILLGHVLVGFWWPVFLLFYTFSPKTGLMKFGRVIQLVTINLAAGLTLSVCFGYSADMFLAMGRYLEREALTAKAIQFYEIGLKKEPQPLVASYLQYRVALINHRLGAREKAIRGFRKVVAKYTVNDELVAKANSFLDNLERSKDKQRVVLAGVDTRTEYKNGYCVPNSLALAMRYWGADDTARGIGRQITGLGSGTYIINQSWYAEQAGFRHDFLPMASIEDIKQCIDAGFPVLVYVPAHAFAIVGYDDALETFVTYDVATYDVWVEYIQKDFVKAWKKQSATLVLAYPPDKSTLIPVHIRDRFIRLSDNYLHYQLYYFDAPENNISVPHLFEAAGDDGEFFFPLTVLHSRFPGLRKRISEKYDPEFVSTSIYTYFYNDFDEAIHKAGQYHDSRHSESDRDLKNGIEYLIGQKQYDRAEELLNRIDEKGQISSAMQAKIGMIHLARGELEPGLDRLVAYDNSDNSFYAGLVNLRLENNQAAIRQLSEAVSGCT